MDDVSEITRELDPTERILWSGRPRQGLRLQASDAIAIPFSLMWGGFAFFWEGTVIHLFWTTPAGTRGPLAFFVLFGSVFATVGAYLVLGRFFADARTRARTWYAITDRRALIVVVGQLRR